MTDTLQNEAVNSRDDAKQRIQQSGTVFDFHQITDSLRQESDWQSYGRNQEGLVHNGPLRVSLHLFKAGKGIPEHTVNGPVAIHVHKGQVRVATASKQNLEVGEGGLIALDANDTFSILATDESVVLLIVAQSDQVSPPAAGNYLGDKANDSVTG